MSDSFPVTKEGYENLVTALQHLKSVERPKVIVAIAEARAHGDLSENAEYDAAKEKQGMIEAKIADLEGKVAGALIIDPASITEDKIVFGATVTMHDLDTDRQRTYMIVGDSEADMKRNRISISSPMSRALIGRKAGEFIEFETANGTRELEILKIEYK